MKIITIMLLLILSSCSHNNNRGNQQLVEEAFKVITGNEISYRADNCPRIEAKCADGEYQEWIQKNGEIACACNN